MFSAAYPILSGGPVVPWAWLLLAALSFYDYDSINPNLRVRNCPTEKIHREYDFIIVGGGSAGSVLASRLTEVQDWSVLLLEAGGDETAISDVPALQFTLLNTDLDWQFKTEPSPNACLAQPDARCSWPRGKMLGGSSAHNGLWYMRGNRKDYDHWESLGNPGWGYKDALYYFKKSEDIRVPDLKDSYYHSTGGPLTVSPTHYSSPLAPAFFQAARELKYPIQDVNGEFQTGFMGVQLTTRDGRRCSAAKAFLRPARNRKNLDIAMHSYVTKVLIDPTTKVAYGVEFVREGKTYSVRARKEVILSAGTIQSPHLLMLSGIGPANELRQQSIRVLQDLKVGYNLQDHVQFIGLTFRITEPVFVGDKELDIVNAVLEYAKTGTGPLTRMGEAAGNINTPYVNASYDWPDVQVVLFPLFTLNTSATDAHPQDIDPRLAHKNDGWGVNLVLNQPKSRGRVKLQSKSPFVYPVLIHNYFTEEIDLLTLIEAVKIALRFSETKAMQRFGSTLNYTNPNCSHIPLYTDAYWACAIRYHSQTIYHLVGSCKMGPYWDPDAVVDPQLRVYGIDRLRVIDASIMPNVPSGNTNAPTIMIAEKGADLIKEQWSSDHSFVWS